jgi:hypothetical protein
MVRTMERDDDDLSSISLVLLDRWKKMRDLLLLLRAGFIGSWVSCFGK